MSLPSTNTPQLTSRPITLPPHNEPFPTYEKVREHLNQVSDLIVAFDRRFGTLILETNLPQLEDETSYLEFKEYCQGTCDVVEYFQYLLETEEAPRALQNDSGVSSLQRLCVALLWKTLCAAPQT